MFLHCLIGCFLAGCRVQLVFVKKKRWSRHILYALRLHCPSFSSAMLKTNNPITTRVYPWHTSSTPLARPLGRASASHLILQPLQACLHDSERTRRIRRRRQRQGRKGSNTHVEADQLPRARVSYAMQEMKERKQDSTAIRCGQNSK